MPFTSTFLSPSRHVISASPRHDVSSLTPFSPRGRPTKFITSVFVDMKRVSVSFADEVCDSTCRCQISSVSFFLLGFHEPVFLTFPQSMSFAKKIASLNLPVGSSWSWNIHNWRMMRIEVFSYWSALSVKYAKGFKRGGWVRNLVQPMFVYVINLNVRFGYLTLIWVTFQCSFTRFRIPTLFNDFADYCFSHPHWYSLDQSCISDLSND